MNKKDKVTFSFSLKLGSQFVLVQKFHIPKLLFSARKKGFRTLKIAHLLNKDEHKISA